MYKINTITTDDSDYLQIAHAIANMPKRLWLCGELPTDRAPTIAIVGTRRPTTYGKEITYKLSYELASRGVVIVSGLALGVDGIAHQAALDAGGTTIAILPTPITSIHPKIHQSLAQRIVAGGGALLSEYGTSDGIYKQNFVARNRIVTAISDGVLITEAATRSGTLTTANFALEQGKTVMAVPGNITNPYSAGCNALIRVGAAAITSTADILHEIGLNASPEAATKLPLAATEEQARILQLISQGVQEGDSLQQDSGLDASTYGQTMTMLEIEGKIYSLGANRWALRV